ncbi:MAG: hypothetical protein AAFR98_11885 [Pseudomonadota bacterium]
MKGYRTITVNFLLAIIPVLELTEVYYALPETWKPWYPVVVLLANMVLRALTTTPIGKS